MGMSSKLSVEDLLANLEKRAVFCREQEASRPTRLLNRAANALTCVVRAVSSRSRLTDER